MTSLLVDGDFYEIVIWVSEVQWANAPDSSTPLHWTLLDLNPTSLEWIKNWNSVTCQNKQTDYMTQYAKGQEANTCRCAATAGRGVFVIRHRSAEPEVGRLALGSNSWPTWCRLNFCCPKPRAFRSPCWNKTRRTVTIRKRVFWLKTPYPIHYQSASAT